MSSGRAVFFLACCRAARSAIGRAALLVLFLTATAPALAAASGLGEGDYRYLQTNFGVGKDSFTLSNVGAEDAARLHELINDPAFKDYAKSRERSVGDYLFGVVMRTCQNWQLTHAGGSCPEVTDARLEPGWLVAERNCIACHLTGTTAAPSFFRLAQSGTVTEKRLADALAGGHQMSPITLSAEQLRNLALYINSLR